MMIFGVPQLSRASRKLLNIWETKKTTVSIKWITEASQLIGLLKLYTISHIS
jgi:hypothetical protein